MDQLSDILKELVPKKGRSNSEVAEKLGISGQLLGAYISGKRSPKTGFYKKWKEVFGDDLLKLETNVSIVAESDPPPYGNEGADLDRMNLPDREKVIILKERLAIAKDQLATERRMNELKDELIAQLKQRIAELSKAHA